MIERCILKHYDSVNHRADIQPLGSVTAYFDNIKVARNIDDADMVLGRHVFIAIPDNNPGNAVVIAVFDA